MAEVSGCASEPACGTWPTVTGDPSVRDHHGNGVHTPEQPPMRDISMSSYIGVV